jgi:hypothetical protein
MHKIYLCHSYYALVEWPGSAECRGIQILTLRYFNIVLVFLEHPVY